MMISVVKLREAIKGFLTKWVESEVLSEREVRELFLVRSVENARQRNEERKALEARLETLQKESA